MAPPFGSEAAGTVLRVSDTRTVTLTQTETPAVEQLLPGNLIESAISRGQPVELVARLIREASSSWPTMTDIPLLVASRRRGDSLIATAPPAQRWLLIGREDPGHAAPSTSSTRRRDRWPTGPTLGARISLIRRPARHPRTPSPFRWAVADIRPAREGIRWNVAQSLDDVVHTPWEVTAGEVNRWPWCAATSNTTCALRGRPVAAAMDPLWPGRVWECSHLGGDRFAATAVLFSTRVVLRPTGSDSGPAAEGLRARHGCAGTPAWTQRLQSARRQAAQALAREAGRAATPSTGCSHYT